jgi:hypothetical protein
MKGMNIMMLLIFLNPTSKSLVECDRAPLVVFLYLSYVQTKKTKNVLVQGISAIHIHVSI